MCTYLCTTRLLSNRLGYRCGGGTKKRSTPPPTSRVTIEHMMTERVEIYHNVPIPGRTIPVEVYLFTIEYSVPDKDEASNTVRRL